MRGFTWWGGASGFVTYLPPNTSQPDVIIGGICRQGEQNNPPCTTVACLPRMMATRSRHPGGVQVAFCDGHVNFISNTIDYNNWQALGTSQGGEPVSDNNY